MTHKTTQETTQERKRQKPGRAGKKSPAAGKAARKASGKTVAPKSAAPNSAAPYDPVQMGQIMARVMSCAQPVLQAYFDKNPQTPAPAPHVPALSPDLQAAYMAFARSWLSNPQKLARMQMQYWTNMADIWGSLAQKYSRENDKPGEDTDAGAAGAPVRTDETNQGALPGVSYQPQKGDRRFRAAAWEENPYFDFLKQAYLMSCGWIREAVHAAEGLDPDTRQRLEFYTRQLSDALAPTNFMLTNPEVLEETLSSGGENLLRGLENFLEDLERGGGNLRISTTDYAAFEPGKNIAVTPGRVIYQNDLMQLIQYDPATKTVYEKPVLIVPPWINKYYILDLRPENSFIKWMVEQGHTVFTISWVNPTAKLAQKRFEDYMQEGLLEALARIKEATGADAVNAVGYCLGGTLLVTAMAYLAARDEAREDNKKQQQKRRRQQKTDAGAAHIATATLMTTLVDFAQAGDLKLFTDESQLALLDREMAEKGVLAGENLQKTFSLLRANDLIWSFVINNYMLGREPFPFDLLYWNDDSTNMPAAMHSMYLRKMYRDNLLVRPGGLSMCDTPIDITKIETPCYFLSTREDHIAPWKATYAATTHLKGPVTFTLAGSGHVAGVINPPAAEKYDFRSADKTPPDPEAWLKTAPVQKGSWWPHWHRWAKAHAGRKVPARKPAKGLEAAPGSYVKMKSR